MNKYEDFSKLLKKKRIQCKFSQEEASRKCYLSKSSYNHYERGKRFPSVEILIRLCSLFNTNPLEFLYTVIPNDIKEDNPNYVSFIFYNSQIKTSHETSDYVDTFHLLKPTEQKTILNIMHSLIDNHKK